jgi:hypothetical protein
MHILGVTNLGFPLKFVFLHTILRPILLLKNAVPSTGRGAYRIVTG